MLTTDFQLCSDAGDEVQWLLENPLFCAEEKIDGDRCRLIRTESGVEAWSRNMRPMDIHPQDVALMMLMEFGTEYDGEIKDRRFIAFDQIIDCEQAARREIMETTCPFPLVRRAIGEADKLALYRTIQEEGGEGIVFKPIHEKYTPGRGRWFRLKNYETDDMKVVAVDVAKCSFEVEFNGQNLGKVKSSFNKLPRVGDIARVRYEKITKNRRLLRAAHV